MYSTLKVFIGMVLGAVITIVAMNYHVVRTKNSWAVFPKQHACLSDTYVDVRDWSVGDWVDRPEFVKTLYENNRQDLIPGLDGRLASLKKDFEK